MRERGNIWPVLSVGGAAAFVLVIIPLIVERQRSGRMATVDAQVAIGDSGGISDPSPAVSKYRWPDSEVPRTAERLRDVTSVSIAAMTYVIEASLKGHVPSDVGEIVKAITIRNLISKEWVANQLGVLRTQYATIHLRYSSRNLSVEVVSIPNQRGDGPAILIRVPDCENTEIGTRYFESMQLDGIIYPSPFAPIPQVIASGWQPRLFKQTQLADADRAQLENWAKTLTQK